VRRQFNAAGQEGVHVTLTYPKFYNEIENIFEGLTSVLPVGDLKEVYEWIGSEPTAGSVALLAKEIERISGHFHENGTYPSGYGTRERCTEEELATVGISELKGPTERDYFLGSPDGSKPGVGVRKIVADSVVEHNKQLELIGLEYESRT